MQNTALTGMTLRLELFVNDMNASLDFYQRVLGFEPDGQHNGGYIPLQNGKVLIGLNLRANLPAEHPIQTFSGEQVGRGVEIVLEVDDVAALYQHVSGQRWPLADTLKPRPWGLTDFRVLDPDGYYLRITSRY